AVRRFDDYPPQAFGDRPELDCTADFGHDSGLARLAAFEQLDDARQTAGDVLRLPPPARYLSNDISRTASNSSPSLLSPGARRPPLLFPFIVIGDQQVGADRHLIGSKRLALLVLDLDSGLALLIRRIDDDQVRKAGDLVDLFANGDALDQILEVNGTG